MPTLYAAFRPAAKPISSYTVLIRGCVRTGFPALPPYVNMPSRNHGVPIRIDRTYNVLSSVATLIEMDSSCGRIRDLPEVYYHVARGNTEAPTSASTMTLKLTRLRFTTYDENSSRHLPVKRPSLKMCGCTCPSCVKVGKSMYHRWYEPSSITWQTHCY